jgi:hypothetical protein
MSAPIVTPSDESFYDFKGLRDELEDTQSDVSDAIHGAEEAYERLERTLKPLKTIISLEDQSG